MQSLRQFGPERGGVEMPIARAAAAEALVKSAVQNASLLAGPAEDADDDGGSG
jgi:hypothetical protein